MEQINIDIVRFIHILYTSDKPLQHYMYIVAMIDLGGRLYELMILRAGQVQLQPTATSLFFLRTKLDRRSSAVAGRHQIVVANSVFYAQFCCTWGDFKMVLTKGSPAQSRPVQLQKTVGIISEPGDIYFSIASLEVQVHFISQGITLEQQQQRETRHFTRRSD